MATRKKKATRKKAPAKKGVKARQKSKNPGGRPRAYSSKLGNWICGEMAKGRSLRSVIQDEGAWSAAAAADQELKVALPGGKMPTYETVSQWKNPGSPYFEQEFSDNYARACEERTNAFADEIVDIADASGLDVVISKGKDGNPQYRVDGETIKRADLRIRARQWMCERMNPKKYGPKQQVDQNTRLSADEAVTEALAEIARTGGGIPPEPFDPTG